jgi:hypothetical protein
MYPVEQNNPISLICVTIAFIYLGFEKLFYVLIKLYLA